jgi:cytochrome c oxidase assembly protein subunit 15
LWALAVLHALDAARVSHARAGALMVATVVTLQATLGILTLLHQAPLALALAHQAMAIIVLTFAVMHAQHVNTGPAEAVDYLAGARHDVVPPTAG